MTTHTRRFIGLVPIALSTVGILLLQLLAAGMFISAGWPKLAGDPAAVQVFDAIGLGQWFRYLTGTIEVAAGVLVLLPATAFYAAVALALTMIGAVATHLFVIGGSPLLALVMLAVTGTIAWARRND